LVAVVTVISALPAPPPFPPAVDPTGSPPPPPPGAPAPPPCGLPPFVEMLPLKARADIMMIWADYKEGTECREQHYKTKAILDTLPPPPAGPPAPPCGLPPMNEMLPTDTKLGIEKIWEGYVEGEECSGQLEATQAFLDMMNKAVMEKYNIPMPPPPCGLPPFTPKLPADAKSKVEEIWADYEMGNECAALHEATKAVIDALPEEVKASVLPPGPPPQPMDKLPNGPSPVGPPPPPQGANPPPPPPRPLN